MPLKKMKKVRNLEPKDISMDALLYNYEDLRYNGALPA